MGTKNDLLLQSKMVLSGSDFIARSEAMSFAIRRGRTHTHTRQSTRQKCLKTTRTFTDGSKVVVEETSTAREIDQEKEEYRCRLTTSMQAAQDAIMEKSTLSVIENCPYLSYRRDQLLHVVHNYRLSAIHGVQNMVAIQERLPSSVADFSFVATLPWNKILEFATSRYKSGRYDSTALMDETMDDFLTTTLLDKVIWHCLEGDVHLQVWPTCISAFATMPRKEPFGAPGKWVWSIPNTVFRFPSISTLPAEVRGVVFRAATIFPVKAMLLVPAYRIMYSSTMNDDRRLLSLNTDSHFHWSNNLVRMITSIASHQS